jgi:lysophospholipase L1-like esterase
VLQTAALPFGHPTLVGSSNQMSPSVVNVAPLPVPNPDPITTGASGSIYSNTGSEAAPRSSSMSPNRHRWRVIEALSTPSRYHGSPPPATYQQKAASPVIHDELEFYNVAELNRVEGVDGLRLQRVPEHVRCQLSDGTAGVMLSPAGSEIRFRIAEANDSVTIRLSSESRTTIYIYHGPFQAGAIELDTEPRDFKIAPHKRIAQLMQVGGPPMAYDPRLVRLCFGGVYPEPVLYHGHSGGVRPPQPQDKPDRTYLAYGSSITHGTDWAGAACSYPAHVAWRLGYDLRNLGASGCCLCEKPLADYLAQQPCDLVTLELSVNMLGSSFTAEGFRQRAGYLVERIADADPDRPVACITVLPHFRDIHDSFCSPEEKATAGQFRQVLRDLVKQLARPNLTLIEGPDLLPDIGDLCADLIHPGARGMVQIGEALARRLGDLVESR